MPTLVYDHEGVRRGGVVDGRVLIGRRLSHGVIVVDPAVSRLHAWIAKDEDGFYQLTDAGSRTGTYVNGQTVIRHELQDGDRIEVGPAVLTFLHDDELPDDAEPVTLTSSKATVESSHAGILFDCSCGAPLWVGNELAGKRGLCRYCGESVQVPKPARSDRKGKSTSKTSRTAAPVAPVAKKPTPPPEPVRAEPLPVEPPPAPPEPVAPEPVLEIPTIVQPLEEPLLDRLEPVDVPVEPVARVSEPLAIAPELPPVAEAVEPSSPVLELPPIQPAPELEPEPDLAPSDPIRTEALTDADLQPEVDEIAELPPEPEPELAPSDLIEAEALTDADVQPESEEIAELPPEPQPAPVPEPPPVVVVKPASAPSPAAPPPTPQPHITPRFIPLQMPNEDDLLGDEPEPPSVFADVKGLSESRVDEVAALALEPAPAPRSALAACGVCHSGIDAEEETTTCPDCQTTFHTDCWLENYGCSTYGCPQVNAIKPASVKAAEDRQSIVFAESTADVPPVPFPVELVLLAGSVIGSLVGAVLFGAVPLLVTLIALGALATRPLSRPGLLLLAIVIGLAGTLGGVALSDFYWFDGRHLALLRW